jgi:hypothetical protein
MSEPVQRLGRLRESIDPTRTYVYHYSFLSSGYQQAGRANILSLLAALARAWTDYQQGRAIPERIEGSDGGTVYDASAILAYIHKTEEGIW